jgi:hypothetical protein
LDDLPASLSFPELTQPEFQCMWKHLQWMMAWHLRITDISLISHDG